MTIRLRKRAVSPYSPASARHSTAVSSGPIVACPSSSSPASTAGQSIRSSRSRLELPASYLEGYLLAVDGYPIPGEAIR
jgi:hypothetical protein